MQATLCIQAMASAGYVGWWVGGGWVVGEGETSELQTESNKVQHYSFRNDGGK